MKFHKFRFGPHKTQRTAYRNVFVRSPVSYVRSFSPSVGAVTDSIDLFVIPNLKRSIKDSWKNCFRLNHPNWRGVEE